MNEPDYKATWFYRTTQPATQPADPRFPNGIVADMRRPDTNLSCTLPLSYPAPGVGSWLIECAACGYVCVVTAAGRRDDPRQIVMPCKKKVDRPGQVAK